MLCASDSEGSQVWMVIVTVADRCTYILTKTKGYSDCIIFYQGFWKIPIRWYFFFRYVLVWFVLHGYLPHKNCAGIVHFGGNDS